jgi:hypothetical protein
LLIFSLNIILKKFDLKTIRHICIILTFMTDKRIKNEQWSVKQLISKIDNKEIKKPKYQRKKKWDTLPKKNSSPNDYAYITFLYDTENSVHAITFGQDSNSERIFYSNIDGNNRINAIKHFMDRPFEIFSEYLDDLKNYIDTLDLSNEDNDLLKDIFYNLSYNQIMNFKYNKYFNENEHKELYNSKLKIHRDDFEPHIEKIQKKLMINESDNFDSTVKINVNLFEGYNTDELCKTFEDINKYNSKLTETELLACRLHNICNFTINNKPFETELNGCIKEYYKDKSNQEVLDCYEFEEEKINAHDFIVGFQNLCNKKYNFIGKTDVDGLSLFFKLYQVLYNSFIDTFTTENVNDFIEKINYSCEILQETVSNLFTDKINDVLFNKSCQDKLKTLKKNNVSMLISSIIGFKEKQEQKSIIIKHLEKCLIYHFFVSDIKEKDTREDLKHNDSITYMAGGSFIENVTKKLLSTPETISNKLDTKLFNKLINHLFNETNYPHERKLDNGNNKNDKRRKLKFFEKTIMFYYYKGKIPTNMLDNEFSIEHIMPNSSEWEGELDKDRTGNLIPIISTINSQRGNKHIDSYKKTKDGSEFCEFIKDIIPDDEEYNIIIKYDKKPTIINNEKYNEMCKKNEKIYLENFINCLFK